MTKTVLISSILFLGVILSIFIAALVVKQNERTLERLLLAQGTTSSETNDAITEEQQNIPTLPVRDDSGRFVKSAVVHTTSAVKVRATPSATGQLLGSVTLGTEATVTGTSEFADGYWWVPLEFATGVSGFSAENFIGEGGAPVTSVQKTAPPVAQPKTAATTLPDTTQTTQFTAAAVATHNTENDCWVIISGSVYDFTQYIPFHPGGKSKIIKYCGGDGTAAFNDAGHSSGAKNQMADYFLATLNSSGTTPTTSPAPPAGTITRDDDDDDEEEDDDDEEDDD